MGRGGGRGMQCIAGTRQNFKLGGSEARRKRYGSLVCDALPIRGVGATRQAREGLDEWEDKQRRWRF